MLRRRVDAGREERKRETDKEDERGREKRHPVAWWVPRYEGIRAARRGSRSGPGPRRFGIVCSELSNVGERDSVPPPPSSSFSLADLDQTRIFTLAARSQALTSLSDGRGAGCGRRTLALEIGPY